MEKTSSVVLTQSRQYINVIIIKMFKVEVKVLCIFTVNVTLAEVEKNNEIDCFPPM